MRYSTNIGVIPEVRLWHTPPLLASDGSALACGGYIHFSQYASDRHLVHLSNPAVPSPSRGSPRRTFAARLGILKLAARCSGGILGCADSRWGEYGMDLIITGGLHG